MTGITERQQKILEMSTQTPRVSFALIFKEFKESASERTIKRGIAELVAKQYLRTSGGGRSVVYEVTLVGRLFAPPNAEIYNGIEVDKRKDVLGSHIFSTC